MRDNEKIILDLLYDQFIKQNKRNEAKSVWTARMKVSGMRADELDRPEAIERIAAVSQHKMKEIENTFYEKLKAATIPQEISDAVDNRIRSIIAFPQEEKRETELLGDTALFFSAHEKIAAQAEKKESERKVVALLEAEKTVKEKNSLISSLVYDLVERAGIIGDQRAFEARQKEERTAHEKAKEAKKIADIAENEKKEKEDKVKRLSAFREQAKKRLALIRQWYNANHEEISRLIVEMSRCHKVLSPTHGPMLSISSLGTEQMYLSVLLLQAKYILSEINENLPHFPVLMYWFFESFSAAKEYFSNAVVRMPAEIGPLRNVYYSNKNKKPQIQVSIIQGFFDESITKEFFNLVLPKSTHNFIAAIRSIYMADFRYCCSVMLGIFPEIPGILLHFMVLREQIIVLVDAICTSIFLDKPIKDIVNLSEMIVDLRIQLNVILCYATEHNAKNTIESITKLREMLLHVTEGYVAKLLLQQVTPAFQNVPGFFAARGYRANKVNAFRQDAVRLAKHVRRFCETEEFFETSDVILSANDFFLQYNTVYGEIRRAETFEVFCTLQTFKMLCSHLIEEKQDRDIVKTCILAAVHRRDSDAMRSHFLPCIGDGSHTYDRAGGEKIDAIIFRRFFDDMIPDDINLEVKDLVPDNFLSEKESNLFTLFAETYSNITHYDAAICLGKYAVVPGWHVLRDSILNAILDLLKMVLAIALNAQPLCENPEFPVLCQKVCRDLTKLGALVALQYEKAESDVLLKEFDIIEFKKNVKVLLDELNAPLLQRTVSQ
ncbi:MAG: hypothetical protein NTZ67_00980 [Gammaproteobacteria bacterium]|nr:hypothetical protein [Gammaproteobacteria bacterium]